MAKKKKKKGLDQFHFHEAADRALSLSEMADTLLSNHGVIRKYPKLGKRLDKIIEHAWKLCNEVHAISEKEFKK
jgi:hypothetical protein